MTFNFETALHIATEAHHGHKNRVGGAYIDTLLQLVDRLRQQGSDEQTLVCALLHNLYEKGAAYTSESLADKGCAPSILEALELLTHIKDQEFIDERSCELIAQAVPAEDATYQAREEEYLQYVARIAEQPLARAVKIADLKLYLEDERLLKAERRELKNKFRQEKYRKALELLENV